MKKCKVHFTDAEIEVDGIILDGCVLLPAPKRADMEPAYCSGSQCYYPPFFAVELAKNMHFNLLPFSTECEWGKYNNGEDSLVRGWYDYYCSTEDYDVKYGYCNTKTGRIHIPPEMGYCADFNAFGAAIFGGAAGNDDEYLIKNGTSRETAEESKRIRDGVYSGLINTKGEIITDTGYVGIIKSHHGVFFVFQTADGWGVVDSEGNELLEPLRGEISWDGMGGFTVRTARGKDGRDTYGIINFEESFCISNGFTEEPAIIYDFPPEKRRKNLSFDEHFHAERFRLTQKDDKYGLIRDVLENPLKPLSTYSELILKPIFDYDELPDAAYNAWVEVEIMYYARILEKTPRVFPGRIGDGWDDVPEDIYEDVRNFMANNGMVQPETVDDIPR